MYYCSHSIAVLVMMYVETFPMGPHKRILHHFSDRFKIGSFFLWSAEMMLSCGLSRFRPMNRPM
jgi:hypothetical protein